MDETANQMSDVREELADVMQRAYADATNGSPFSGAIKYPIADAILARFDVTEKPVVTDAVLGDMAALAVNVRHWHPVTVGQLLRQQLTEAGLMIVRMEDGRR